MPRPRADGLKINGEPDLRLKTKLSLEIVEALYVNVRAGRSFVDACAIVGVGVSTAKRWVQAGREAKAKPLERLIARKLELAAAGWAEDREAILVDSPDWRAHAWLLERKRPADYGQTQRIESKVQGEVAHRHTLELEALSTDELAAMARMLEKAGAPEIIDGEVIDLPVRELERPPEPEL